MRTIRKIIVIVTILLLVVFTLTSCINLNGIKATGGGKLTIETINDVPAEGKAIISFKVEITEMPDENALDDYQNLTADGNLNFRHIDSGMNFRAKMSNVIYFNTGAEERNEILFYGKSRASSNSFGEDIYIYVYAQEIISTQKQYVNIIVFDELVDPLNPPTVDPLPICSYKGVLTGKFKINTY